MRDAHVRFVQFPHPGGEHRPDMSGGKRWSSVDRPHARKFLSLEGKWLNDTRRRTGNLWAWGESTVLRTLDQTNVSPPTLSLAAVFRTQV